MSLGRIQEIISTPGIADGNPATAQALRNLAIEHEIAASELLTLPITSLPAGLFHNRMTHDPSSAQDYTQGSEAKRVDAKARIFAALSFAEFALNAKRLDRQTPVRWNVIQEHQLLGASRRVLSMLGIRDVRLVTPDVFPKESGILAAQAKRAEVHVWNQEALKAAENAGVVARLIRPFLLEGHRPGDESFDNPGPAIVVKSSGSGMPERAKVELNNTLFNGDRDWVIHSPRVLHGPEGSRIPPQDRFNRIQAFYGDLSSHTRVLIGYPSELVGVGFEMKQRGVPLWMLTFPPRGEHELKNLRFGLEHGLVYGELELPGHESTDMPGLEIVPLNKINEIAQTPNDTPLPADLLGSTFVWAD